MSSSVSARADSPTDWAAERARYEARIAELQHQLEWFKRQLFGEKSERRLLDAPPEQLSLGEGFEASGGADGPARAVVAHQRRTRAKASREDETPFFDPARVPVERIEVPNPALQGLDADDFEVIAERSTYRLAQRPASYVILQYVRRTVKRKDSGAISCPGAPPAVLEGSRADVSFLAGLIVEKFQYHLPLYRQHQRLAAAGIEVSRQWLTQLVLGAAALLAPIVAAQWAGIRACRVRAMDETPIKAGRRGAPKGKLKTGYFWPIWGDTDDGGGGDLVFLYRPSRAAAHVREGLGDTAGKDQVLISDGYSAYARYAAQTGITHAQCWAHTRRHFEYAKDIEPEAVAVALEHIGALYTCEKHLRTEALSGQAKAEYRATRARPVVEAFFDWAERQLQQAALLPSNPLTKALNYALERRAGLMVYLNDPAVPIDTNHLERALRPIPMGRKAWLFCWSEVGAEAVATFQSLIASCRLHDIDPYIYLVDVLQRIDRHPASQVEQLIPRLWKQRFADSPLRSDLHKPGR